MIHDEPRLVVSDYFLNEDTFGKVHRDGDHEVHVANVSSTSLTLDPAFNFDFDNGSTGPARPHGLAFK